MALFGKPRIFRLAEVASRAELLRRRRQVHGVAVRAGLGGAAAAFALVMLLWLHVAAWAALARPLGPAGAALVVVALDLALVLVLAWLAARGRTDATVDEAVAVRDTALRGARAELQTLGGLLRRPGSSAAATYDAHEETPRRRRARVYPS